MKIYNLTRLGAVLAATTCNLISYAQSDRNVLVIVADDLGKDVLSIYNTPTAERAITPNIDKLAQNGIIYNNMWGSPLSAPARAAMLTGRYGHHTGIVALDITLPESEETLFEALPEEYSNAVIGKWHLSKDDDFASKYGIDYFAGFSSGGALRDYSNWRFTENGKSEFITEYSTTKITDSAINWIKDQDSPWVCWIAYNAPHTPIHLPPSHMHTRGELSGEAADIEKNSLQYYFAMVESLDYDLGRLLESIDESTTIIFVGDNGTDNSLLQSPYPARHGKGTLYDSGVSIPMVIAGAGVNNEGTQNDCAINAVDIFPTILELTGKSISHKNRDSYSFAETFSGGESKRKYTFSEIYNKRNGYMCALSNSEYKIIATSGKTTMMFDLKNDPLEKNNILNSILTADQKTALKTLEKELNRMDIPEVSIPTTKQNRMQGNNNRPAMQNRNQININRQQR